MKLEWRLKKGKHAMLITEMRNAYKSFSRKNVKESDYLEVLVNRLVI
jgi:hypothetical protein